MKASEFIIEGKKNRRDKRHSIKPKAPNPVAKNAMAAVGGGGFGAHKDKKKAAKQGDVKHKGKVDEMDKSQTPPGRDGGSSGGKEYRGKPLTAKQMMDKAHKTMMKSMSNDEKKDKGWRNPNIEEGDYPDGSSIKTPGANEWKQQYQQAVMAVKNAKTQQEYEAASDRASRIKDLLASKGIQVGPVLGQQGVAEGLPQTLRKVVPGYAKREIDKKMDAGKFGKTDADKDTNFYRYKKIQDKIKEQGEADYGPDYQDKVKRLGQMAKQGERKTVWDPVKRVYKTVPVNADPQKK